MKKVHLPLYTVKIVNIILTVVVVAFAFIASFLENYTMCLAITIVFLIIDIGFMFIFWRCPHCGRLLQFSGSLKHCGHCGKKIDES